MTSEEIKTMFQANAFLRNSMPFDLKRAECENTLQDLTSKFCKEYLDGEDICTSPKDMSLQDALQVLVSACQALTSFELQHHPNGLTDEAITQLVAERKYALDVVVNAALKS